MEVTYIIKYNLCFEDDTKLVRPLLHMQKLPLQDNTKLKTNATPHTFTTNSNLCNGKV